MGDTSRSVGILRVDLQADTAAAEAALDRIIRNSTKRWTLVNRQSLVPSLGRLPPRANMTRIPVG